MTAENGPLDDAIVTTLYREHSAELRRFLVAVLRDDQLASDVLQTAFAKLVEQGGGTQADKRKAWLFQVAYREALAVRRREGLGSRVLETAAWSRPALSPAADEPLVRREVIERIRGALDELPPDQRCVVRMRIYEEKTFAEIARELKIPLGTALARMHAALHKLRKRLGENPS